jgi:putative endonuclease
MRRHDRFTFAQVVLGLKISVRQAKAGLMFYVYILRSRPNPGQTYFGSTGNLRQRLAEHNSGKSIHTNKFRPWHLETYVALPEKQLAEEFEKYLKTGSGRAFAARHFVTRRGRSS